MRQFLTIGFIFSLSLVFGHKSYISIATLEYNETLNQIEISIKLTAHDFEHVLESKFNERIVMEHVKDSSDIDKYVQNYLSQNFILKSNGQKAKFNYVGKEVDVRDQLFFYFTFTQVLNPSHISIQNSILFELFLKQQNIIHYKYKGVTKSVTLHANKKSDDIEF